MVPLLDFRCLVTVPGHRVVCSVVGGVAIISAGQDHAMGQAASPQSVAMLPGGWNTNKEHHHDFDANTVVGNWRNFINIRFKVMHLHGSIRGRGAMLPERYCVWEM